LDANSAARNGHAVLGYLSPITNKTNFFFAPPPDRIQIFTLTGRDAVIAPSQEDLVLLNVVNNCVKQTKWTTRVFPKGFI
jgi:hypothetical protein